MHHYSYLYNHEITFKPFGGPKPSNSLFSVFFFLLLCINNININYYYYYYYYMGVQEGSAPPCFGLHRAPRKNTKWLVAPCTGQYAPRKIKKPLHRLKLCFCTVHLQNCVFAQCTGKIVPAPRKIYHPRAPKTKGFSRSYAFLSTDHRFAYFFFKMYSTSNIYLLMQLDRQMMLPRSLKSVLS